VNNKWFVFLIVAFSLIVQTACSSSTATSDKTGVPATIAPSQAATAATYADPFAYCAVMGQIDTPDVRYTGPTMNDDLFNDYLIAAGLDPSTSYPDNFKQMTIWRCMDNKVYACNFGANIPCNSKADINKTPSQAMNDYCTQNPDNTFIPMSVTGHSTIYDWHCDKTTAEILDQFDTVDIAGYQSSFWTLLTANASAVISTTQPAANATPPAGNKQIIFYSNRDGGVNNIYLLTIGNTSPFILTQGQDSYFSGPYSPDGNRILFTGFGLTNSYVGVMNADGSNPVNLTNQTNSDDAFPAWSPDGTQIVFTSNRDGNNEIYVMNSTGGQLKRLTNNPRDDFAPSWSPDGKKIAFLSDRDNETGVYSIYQMNPDGSGVTRLTHDNGNDYTPSWSPDGNKVVFRLIQNGQSDIYTIAADGSGMTDLTNNPAEDWSPTWSPDGSQIAFQSNRDGNWEIYVMNANGSNQVNVTNDPSDDQSPYWKP
jgi:Tol biopolymer transport system component